MWPSQVGTPPPDLDRLKRQKLAKEVAEATRKLEEFDLRHNEKLKLQRAVADTQRRVAEANRAAAEAKRKLDDFNNRTTKPTSTALRNSLGGADASATVYDGSNTRSLAIGDRQGAAPGHVAATSDLRSPLNNNVSKGGAETLVEHMSAMPKSSTGPDKQGKVGGTDNSQHPLFIFQRFLEECPGCGNMTHSLVECLETRVSQDCVLCNTTEHMLRDCQRYREMALGERLDVIFPKRAN